MKLRLPSPAMIVALLALFVATTGTAVAGVMITGANVKNNTLSTLDVMNNTLTTTDVRNGSLLPIDFKKLPIGQKGPKGDAGENGAPGAPGVSGLEVVSMTSPTNSGAQRGLEVPCPAGKRVLGGGAEVVGGSNDVAIYASHPLPGQTSWRAWAHEVDPTGDVWSLSAYAICANVTP